MIDPPELTLLIIAISFTGINFFGCWLSLNYLSKNRKKYHRNQLFLRIFHVFVCMLASITIAFAGTILIACDETVYNKLPQFLSNVYTFEATLFSACALCVRLGSFGLTVERLIATCLSSTYEKRCNNTLIGIFLATLALVFCGILSFIYHAKIWNFFVHLSIISFLDGINLFGLMALIRQNKKLRKIDTRSDIVLSQRYQITQTLKTLFELQPMLISQSLLMLLGTVSGFILMAYNVSRFYIDWIYYFLMNLSFCVLFAAAYIYRRIKATKRQLRMNEQARGTGGVINALGQVMEVQQSNNEYFNQLQGQWN